MRTLVLLSIFLASTCFGMSLEENSAFEKIAAYLSQYSLAPVLEKREAEYLHLGFINDAQGLNTHALGMIKQGTRSYSTLFSLKKSWLWGEIEAKLLYLTTDQLITPLLFADITHLASCYLRKDPSNFHVLIEKAEDPSLHSDSTLQKWTFFNVEESQELFVVLTPDGQGGTFFHFEIPMTRAQEDSKN